MKLTLHCPANPPAVPALAAKGALVLVPFVGKTVLEHALAGLASDGFRHIRIHCTDHMQDVQKVVGQGEAWGVRIEFSGEPVTRADWADERVLVLDALPQLPDHDLWSSYRAWFSAQLALIPTVARLGVGTREVEPGVFVGLRSRIAADARLIGPCWIGANVHVAPGATIGPGAVIEDGSFIDGEAGVSGSVVGPNTYVGRCTELRDSFAWGNRLLHLDTGSLTEVTDRFLLAELQPSGLVDRFRAAIRAIGATASSANTDALAGRMEQTTPKPSHPLGNWPASPTRSLHSPPK
jgi:hypothetical protein